MPISFPLFFLILSLFVSFIWPSAGQARINSLSTSISIREGYNSNLERYHTDEKEEFTTTILPAFNFVSQGRRDDLSLSYTPGIQYSDKSDNPETITDEHHFQISDESILLRNLQLTLSETFLLTNDSYLQDYYLETPEQGVIISEDVQRRTFWTNTAIASISWRYYQGCNVTISYTDSIYEQKDNFYEGDYDRHIPSINLEQKFGLNWRTTLSFSHSKTKFEPASSQPPDDSSIIDTSRPADLESNNASIRIHFTPSQHTALFATGTYGNNKFEEALGEELEPDYTVYSGQLGWHQILGHNVTADFLAGPYVVDWANNISRPDEKTFSYEGLLTRTLDRGEITFGGRGGVEDLYYNGTNDGLSKYWLVETSLDYQLQRQLSVNLSGIFRSDIFASQDVITGDNIKEELLRFGLGLSYTLNDWTTLQLRYSFRDLNTNKDSNNNRYNDNYIIHRLFLEVRISKEVWRW